MIVWEGGGNEGPIGSLLAVKGKEGQEDEEVVCIVMSVLGVHLLDMASSRKIHPVIFRPYKALAKSWIHKRVKLFAPPGGAASDASPLFRNSFEKNSYRAQGIMLQMSATYHPIKFTANWLILWKSKFAKEAT